MSLLPRTTLHSDSKQLVYMYCRSLRRKKNVAYWFSCAHCITTCTCQRASCMDPTDTGEPTSACVSIRNAGTLVWFLDDLFISSNSSNSQLPVVRLLSLQLTEQFGITICLSGFEQERARATCYRQQAPHGYKKAHFFVLCRWNGLFFLRNEAL